MKTTEHQDGWNQAANDYEERKSQDVTDKSEDYQTGYHAGWEHNAAMTNGTLADDLECDHCYNGTYRPCHICGAS